MKRINTYLIITAVLLIALGVVCIIHPGASFASTAWLMGLLIIASGISSLIFGLRAQAFLPNAGSTTLLAVFQIIVGLMLATDILASEVALIAVFSMWVLFEGVSLAVLSIDYKKGGYDRWWLMLLLGLCSIVLGFLALRNPEKTGIFLGVLLGIGILANGIVRIVAFFGLKRIENRLRDLKESATATPIDDINPSKVEEP
ncbi:MAG: DUF308 domain-containing protein [Bacteroidales bacterium]|nr:DUF308 domain-containing protein [Bacteroidales bacterium]